MKPNKIIMAWKDEEYRASLTAEEQAALPVNPAGVLALNEEDLDLVGGAFPSLVCLITTGEFCFSVAIGGTCRNWSTGCCGPLPF